MHPPLASSARRRAGFSLVEVIIAISVLVLIAVNVGMVSRVGRSAAESGVLMLRVDDELHLTMDRISLALMAADSEEVDGLAAAPLPSDWVQYQAALGTNDGEVVHGPVEDVSWRPAGDGNGTVQWRERPDEETERQIVWSKHVPIAYQSEILENLEDDNGNDLLDEAGLAFTKDARTINIHVTVEREGEDGRSHSTHKKSVITCRN
ncbi:MAG: prepilin-type N-terminal cleavage/methylation domain-containing protein [Planctomycetota bacterium]